MPEGRARSIYCDDPDLQDIVGLFIEELPERVAAIEAAHASGQLENVRWLAHQLHGSSGGYGFAFLGTAAAHVERLAERQKKEELSDALAMFRQIATAIMEAKP